MTEHYDIVLRKVKSGQFKWDIDIVYRDFEANIDNPYRKYSLMSYCGAHSEMSLDYYRKQTVPATQKECQNLIDTLFRNGETYKIWKKLNYKTYGEKV